MKKVIVIGASGSLAQYVIEALTDLEGIELTLFVRNKNRLSKSAAENYTVVEGDAMNYDDVKKAIEGQDIVYVNLAGNLEVMANNIVKAMQQAGVKRIIAISSIGIYETPLRSVLVAYRKLADVIETSGLDYTILRPDWFTNANEIDYALTKKASPKKAQRFQERALLLLLRPLLKTLRSTKGRIWG